MRRWPLQIATVLSGEGVNRKSSIVIYESRNDIARIPDLIGYSAYTYQVLKIEYIREVAKIVQETCSGACYTWLHEILSDAGRNTYRPLKIFKIFKSAMLQGIAISTTGASVIRGYGPGTYVVNDTRSILTKENFPGLFEAFQNKLPEDVASYYAATIERACLCTEVPVKMAYPEGIEVIPYRLTTRGREVIYEGKGI